jgi:hypothetical protein
MPLEMTTDEIISRLQATGDQKMIDELRELFQTADLVKFAKYSTQLNENDLNLVKAINFIDETKQEGQAVEERSCRAFRRTTRRHAPTVSPSRHCSGWAASWHSCSWLTLYIMCISC